MTIIGMPSLKNAKRNYTRRSFLAGTSRRRHRNNALVEHRTAMRNLRRTRAAATQAAYIEAQIARTLEDNMLFAEAEREGRNPEEIEAIFAAKKRRAAHDRAALAALNDDLGRLGI